MIVEYYKKTRKDYERGWDCDNIHYGLWDKDVKNNKQALNKMNDKVAELLDIKNSDFVVDLGCGTGFVAKYIRDRYKVKVVGVTIVGDILKYKDDVIVGDFHYLPFKIDSVDKMYAIESFCYSDKLLFLYEVFLSLRRNGKIVIADGFLSCEKHRNNVLYKVWKKGWAVKDLLSVDDVKRYMKMIGFKNIVIYDVTDKIYKSAKIMFVKSLIFLPFLIFDKIRFRNLLSGVLQLFLIKFNVLRYCIVIGDK